MSEESGQKSVVRAYVDAFNRGDVDAVCAQFTEDAQVFGVLGWGGLEAVRPIWQELVCSLRMHLQVEAMAEEGDTVAVRYIERGTFAEAFRGIEPTGRTYEVTAMEWFVLRDGRIHRRWGARDSAAIFKQLGIPLG